MSRSKENKFASILKRTKFVDFTMRHNIIMHYFGDLMNFEQKQTVEITLKNNNKRMGVLMDFVIHGILCCKIACVYLNESKHFQWR